MIPQGVKTINYCGKPAVYRIWGGFSQICVTLADTQCFCPEMPYERLFLGENIERGISTIPAPAIKDAASIKKWFNQPSTMVQFWQILFISRRCVCTKFNKTHLFLVNLYVRLLFKSVIYWRRYDKCCSLLDLNYGGLGSKFWGLGISFWKFEV